MIHFSPSSQILGSHSRGWGSQFYPSSGEMWLSGQCLFGVECSEQRAGFPPPQHLCGTCKSRFPGPELSNSIRTTVTALVIRADLHKAKVCQAL